MPAATEISFAEAFFVEGYQPGYIGRIVELHGRYYSQAWGSGAEFESLTAIELSDFCRHYQPDRDLLLTAHIDQELVGSIAVQGSLSDHGSGGRVADRTARLRWFILDAAHRGKGIGRKLLQRSLEFCRNQQIAKLYLWTVDELPQAHHLYESVGFTIVEQVADCRYGVPLLHLKMELELDSGRMRDEG